MEKVSLAILIGLFTFSSFAHAEKPTCEKLEGEWLSDSKSTLTISSVNAEGQLKGTYTPYQFAEKPAPLIGWTNHSPLKKDKDNVKIVSFTVNWLKHGSVTSWSGTCSSDKGIPVIKAIANLARSNSSYTWDHIITDSNRYTPK